MYPPGGLAVRTEQIVIPVCAGEEFAFLWTLFSHVEVLSWNSLRLEPSLYLDCIGNGIKNNLPSVCKKGTVPSHQTGCGALSQGCSSPDFLFR